jgi:uncharacterized protein YlzI (FlbEa/FlbD family)
MIIVSRLNGERFGVNAEQIERIEETPDTVLTLVEGRKYIVRESLEEVIERVVAYRARVLRVSYIPAEADDGDDPPLRLVQDSLGESADPRNGGN